MSEVIRGAHPTPESGIEKAQDEKNLRNLADKHPDIDPAEIQRVYGEVKEELIARAEIHTYIPVLAFRTTHERLTELKKQGGQVKEGQ